MRNKRFIIILSLLLGLAYGLYSMDIEDYYEDLIINKHWNLE